MTFTEKIAAAPPASFHLLDPAKAKRLGGRTMYIPPVGDVLAYIRSIPYGETRSFRQMKADLAVLGKAEIACPVITNQYWKWLSAAAEFEGGEKLPWWRVLRDGKPNPQMPGGELEHLARVVDERIASGQM